MVFSILLLMYRVSATGHMTQTDQGLQRPKLFLFHCEGFTLNHPLWRSENIMQLKWNQHVMLCSIKLILILFANIVFHDESNSMSLRCYNLLDFQPVQNYFISKILTLAEEGISDNDGKLLADAPRLCFCCMSVMFWVICFYWCSHPKWTKS